jgi:hypothetical protein
MTAEEPLARLLREDLEHVRPVPGAWASLRERLQDEAHTPLSHRVWEWGLSRREFIRGAATVAAAALLPAPSPVPPTPAQGPPPAAGPDLPVYAPPAPDEHDLYLPGVGFRRPHGMASRQQVSVEGGELTLTVHRVAALIRGTWLDLEVSGIRWHGPRGTGPSGLDVRLGAAGEIRKTAAGLTRATWDRRGKVTVRQVRRLGPLGPDVTQVEVIASGELLGAELRAAVPLVPSVEAGLPAVRLAGEPAVANGVSIQVTNAVLGADRTVLLLRVELPPPAGFAWLGRPFRCRIRGEELVLRDTQDREYLEELPTGVGFSHDQTVFDDVVHFPPLPPDASGLRLVVPLVTLATDTGNPQAIDGPWIAPLGI